MGMTPLAGLTMGTRAGDMDAGVVEYIANKYSMTVSETVRVLNKESGVLGLSGVSSDFRDLHAAAGQGHRRAALALDVFCYGVRKMIAGYAAAMGGVDTVVFTAGVRRELRRYPPRGSCGGWSSWASPATRRRTASAARSASSRATARPSR